MGKPALSLCTLRLPAGSDYSVAPSVPSVAALFIPVHPAIFFLVAAVFLFIAFVFSPLLLLIALLFFALFFFISYSLYFVVRRPAFLYSAAILLPFCFTSIAFLLNLLADKFGVRFFYVIAALLLSWNMYLYPLVTAKKVPLAPYRFIIEHADLKTH